MIKETPFQERPREKAYREGVAKLSNVELLAILLRTGTKGKSSLDLAQQLLSLSGGIGFLPDLTLNQLIHIKGIKKVKAIELLATFEIAARIKLDPLSRGFKIHHPKDVFNHFLPRVAHLKQEHFVVIFLNTKQEMISYQTLFIGSLNTTVVHPREIYKAAINYSSASIICMHNHPSGDVTPSKEDIEMTKILSEAGQLLNILLIDHIIISKYDYFSFKEANLLSE